MDRAREKRASARKECRLGLRRLAMTGWMAVAASLLCLGGGCKPRDAVPEASVRSPILILGNGHEPSDLDPHTISGVSEINIVRALFEGLLTYSAEHGGPAPGVASSWAVEEDGLLYRFRLREDARWSNGDRVEAKHFIYSWRRALDPRLGSPNASMLFPVSGARDYHQGRLRDFTAVGFAEDGNGTLSIRLESPMPWFPEILLHPVWFPVHPPTLESMEAFARRGSGWTQPETMVSNGPFRLTRWRANESVEVARNPHYHGAARVRLAGIRFLPVENRNTEEMAFLSGQIHVTYSFPSGKLAHYERTRPHLLRRQPYLGTEYYLLNTKAPPLDDPRVRRALSLALRRTPLAVHVLGSGQEPAFRFTPPALAGYGEAVDPLPEEVEAARLLLAEAGFPAGRGFPALTLTFNTSDSNRRLAEAVQEMWRTQLGIRLILHNLETRSYFAARREGAFQILRASWIGDYQDPSTFLELWTSWSTHNFSGWADPEYDRLLEEARRTQEAGLRSALLAQAENLLLQTGPVVPLYHYVNVFLVQPQVRGWEPNLLGWVDYSGVWLEEP